MNVEVKQRSQRWRDIAVALWTSFLAASGASVLCYAFVDPVDLELLRGIDSPFLARMTGYALGFFFFWGVALAACLLTLYLVRTADAASTAAVPPWTQEDR
jgi:hypothetical protein